MEYLKDKEKRYSYDLMNIVSILSQETPPEHIKVKELPNQPKLNYVSGDYVIGMLNKLFLYQWSFTIEEQFVQPSWNKKATDNNAPVAQVKGSLTIPGLGTRQQFGSKVFVGNASQQESAFKSAATDALKKCAASFGIAIDLYVNQASSGGVVFTTPNDFLTEEEKQIIWKTNKGLPLEERAKDDEKSDTPSNPPVIESSNNSDVSTMAEHEFVEKISNPEIVSVSEEEIREQELITDSFDTGIPPNDETIDIPSEEISEVPNEEPVEQKYSKGKAFTKEEINELKSVKEKLGISHNDELNPYLKQFFEDEEANWQYITNKNIKNVIIYLNKQV